MELDALMDRLTAVEPGPFPFISLYLDTRPDQHGRDQYRAFVRKELRARARTYEERSAARASFDGDIARIEAYLDEQARPASNGIAIFACAGTGFFEAVQLSAPLDESELVVAPRPHVYPLARLTDRYPRYAAVVTDTHTARIFVFGLGAVEAAGDVTHPKQRRTAAGGWSQARYQRHIEHYHLQHIKDLVDALDRVVRAEHIDRIVLAGDEVALPLVRDQLPKALAERVVDLGRADVRTPERDIFEETLAAVRAHDARDDAEKVRRMLDAYRAGGLGVAGLEETRAALANGQVYELLLSADPRALECGDGRPGAEIADELVRQARQTGAAVTFVDDPALLAGVGGVGALLRYRIRGRAA